MWIRIFIIDLLVIYAEHRTHYCLYTNVFKVTEFEKDGMRSNTVTVGLHGCRFTSSKAFLNMLREVHDMAGQHEVIAENTQQQLIADIQKTVNELKQDRKKVQ